MAQLVLCPYPATCPNFGGQHYLGSAAFDACVASHRAAAPSAAAAATAAAAAVTLDEDAPPEIAEAGSRIESAVFIDREGPLNIGDLDREIHNCREVQSWGGGCRSSWVDELDAIREANDELVDAIGARDDLLESQPDFDTWEEMPQEDHDEFDRELAKANAAVFEADCAVRDAVSAAKTRAKELATDVASDKDLWRDFRSDALEDEDGDLPGTPAEALRRLADAGEPPDDGSAWERSGPMFSYADAAGNWSGRDGAVKARFGGWAQTRSWNPDYGATEAVCVDVVHEIDL
jgi:hypothetical protein